jgi:preprotein translocase subunit SecE
LAKKPGNLSDMKTRAQRAKAASGATPGGLAAAPRKRTNPVKFAQEVRAEARKITWTNRRESWITSVMVFIMVALAALFFFATDSALSFIVGSVLRLATT